MKDSKGQMPSLISAPHAQMGAGSCGQATVSQRGSSWRREDLQAIQHPYTPGCSLTRGMSPRLLQSALLMTLL